MKLKKTKSGKFSLTLSHGERYRLWAIVIGYVEREHAQLITSQLNKVADITACLYATVLSQVVHKDFALQHNNDTKMTLTRAEAVALLWLLFDSNQMFERELKGTLHKQLI